MGRGDGRRGAPLSPQRHDHAGQGRLVPAEHVRLAVHARGDVRPARRCCPSCATARTRRRACAPESARDFYNLPDAALAGTRRLERDPHRRRGSSPIRTLVKRDLDSGLIPDHLLSGEQPDVGLRRGSSLDFFKPSKNERPRTVPGPMNYAHEYRVHKKPDAARALAVQGAARAPSARRRRCASSRTRSRACQPKRNPDVNPRGISRNIMGGFYTN